VSFFLGYALSAFSQIPQGFNYQAVAHNTSGAVIPLATMQVKASILSDTLAPVIIWEELHSTVKTNNAGVFSIVIGTGTKQAGSAASFSAIDWSKGIKFLKIQIYYQNAWKYMGTSKLWTVPYAMSSGNLAGGVSKFSVKGQETSPDSALFVVKNKNGQIVFAVFNEGVRIYVDDGAKGSKGGFAVGSFGTEKGTSQNLLTVSSDSVRIYVDETAAKGSKGGFAVGGFSEAKGTVNEFMFLTPENYFIGHGSGQKVTTGIYNSTLGFESGMSLTEGLNNIFIGYQSGYFNNTGSSNVFIGKDAGYSNLDGDYNIFIGRGSGEFNTSGWSNIILGDFAGSSNETGFQNVMIGDLAGMSNIDGAYNVIIGGDAGLENTSGSNNVFIGKSAGYDNTTGDYNTFLGYQAGYSSGASSYSTSVGYKAGYSLSDWQAGTYLGYEAGLNSTGRQNVFLGAETGKAFTTGADNVVIGAGAGSSPDSPFTSATGSRNTMIGYYTGYKSSSATDNVIVGAQNPFSVTNITGSYNVYLGVDAGNEAAGGSRNVFIGYQAGKYETTSDKLYIDNTSNNSANALIYGDFLNNYLRLNAWVGINSSPSLTYRLYLSGSAYATGNWYIPSDIRLKENITSLAGSDVITRLKDVSVISYNYVDGLEKGEGESKKDYIGVSAQDLEKSFPALVSNDENGYKAVSVNGLTSVLLQAVQDLNKEIEKLKAEIEALKSK
jgi:hypothetical protein